MRFVAQTHVARKIQQLLVANAITRYIYTQPWVAMASGLDPRHCLFRSLFACNDYGFLFTLNYVGTKSIYERIYYV